MTTKKLSLALLTSPKFICYPFFNFDNKIYLAKNYFELLLKMLEKASLSETTKNGFKCLKIH